jgi:hypothetical protein
MPSEAIAPGCGGHACSFKNRLFTASRLACLSALLQVRLGRLSPSVPIWGLRYDGCQLPSTLARPSTSSGRQLVPGRTRAATLARHLGRHCHTFVDIGAHIGCTALHAGSRHAPLMVYYFCSIWLYGIIRNLPARGRATSMASTRLSALQAGPPSSAISTTPACRVSPDDASHPLRSMTVEVVTFDAFAHQAGLRDDTLSKSMSRTRWARRGGP